MTPNSLPQSYENAMKSARPEGATNTSRPLTETRTMEVQGMAVKPNIRTQSPKSIPQTWKSIGELARKLAEQARDESKEQ